MKNWRQILSLLIESIVIIGSVAIFALWQFERLELLNTAMLFLIPIVYSGMKNGKLVTLLVSLMAAMVLNVLFIPDRFSIVISNIHYLISFFMMIALGQLIASLAQKSMALERLETSKKVQEALLGLLSHELKTPLTAIKGSSSALLDHTIILDSHETEYLLESIDESANEMEKLINNLLDTARLQSGHFDTKKELFHVGELAKSLLHRYDSKNEIEYHIHDENLYYYGDSGLIEMALKNLIDNALKYGTERKMVIEMFANNQICIRLCNKGKLPQTSELSLAKQPFVRLSNAKGKRGAGLGLYVIDLVAKLHGGEVGILKDNEELCVSMILPQREQ